MSECPQCGAPAEPGQLVCVECGSRLGLEPGRAGLSPLLVALLLAVVALGAGAAGFALSEVTGDDDGDGGTELFAGGTTEQEAPRETAPEPPPETVGEAATGAPQEPTRSLLLEWPDGLTAHTVVLVTTSDRAAARRLARQAAQSGIEAGLLPSEPYDLGTDLWIVFAGRFDSRTGAVRQAADLAERYPGAYAQLIQPVSG